jgi:hypothetical protein
LEKSAKLKLDTSFKKSIKVLRLGAQRQDTQHNNKNETVSVTTHDAEYRYGVLQLIPFYRVS